MSKISVATVVALAAACGGGKGATTTPTSPADTTSTTPRSSPKPAITSTSSPTDDLSKRKKLKSLTPAEMPWTPLVAEMGDKGPHVASLWGDMSVEPNGFFIKLPAGDKGQLHTHTNDYHGVTITRVSVGQDGGKVHPLAAGTYYFQPGGTAHINACPGTSPCISFAHYNIGKRDYAPATPSKGATPDPRVVEKPLASVTWTPFDSTNPKAGGFASLWGDMKAENGMFIKLPAGNPAFWHIHKHDYHAVVLQGTLDHHESGSEGRDLPAGSYYWQPGGNKHVDLCKAGGPDCVVYVFFTGGFDVIPAQ